MNKKTIIILICLVSVFLLAVVGISISNSKTKEKLDKIENNYSGPRQVNGILVDSNCGLEDPVVQKITSMLETVVTSSSILQQVANPAEDDRFHLFLIDNFEDYDRHTYWLYVDKYIGYLFYETFGEPHLVVVYP